MQLYFILINRKTPINYGDYSVIVFDNNDNSLLDGDVFGDEVHPYPLS